MRAPERGFLPRHRIRAGHRHEGTESPLPPQFTSEPTRFFVRVVEGTVVRDDDGGASIEVQELDDGQWRLRWVPDLSACDPRCGKTYTLVVGGKVAAATVTLGG